MEGLPKSLDSRVANLFGEIIALDRSVGMLRQGLRDMGLAENTLIWFCSDNGGATMSPIPSAGSGDLKAVSTKGHPRSRYH